VEGKEGKKDNLEIDLMKDEWDVNLEIDIETDKDQQPLKNVDLMYSSSAEGEEITKKSIKNSLFAGHHAAVANFPQAMKLLNKQLAIIHFEPLKNIMTSISKNSMGRGSLLPNIPPSLLIFNNKSKPVVYLQLEHLIQLKQVSRTAIELFCRKHMRSQKKETFQAQLKHSELVCKQHHSLFLNQH
jgi:hypothetical protein